MSDATTLEALAVRVEAGEAGREIDFLVWEALEPEKCKNAIQSRRQVSPKGTPLDAVRHLLMVGGGAQKFSTSLDAVAALAERVLPVHQFDSGYTWGSSEGTGEGYYASIDLAFGAAHIHVVMAPTECAARLAAILRAKAKDQTND